MLPSAQTGCLQAHTVLGDHRGSLQASPEPVLPPGAQAALAIITQRLDTEQEEGMVAHASGALSGKPHQESKFWLIWIEPRGQRLGRSSGGAGVGW